MSKWTFESIKIKSLSTASSATSSDVTELVDNPFAGLEDRADPKVPTATLQIYEFINDYLSRTPDTHVNRASSATMCLKRRWYQKQGIIGDNLTPRKIVNFSLGDLSEKIVLYFIKQACVGPGKLYSEVDFGKVTGTFPVQGKTFETYEQDHLTAAIPGLHEPITAHADGWGKRNSDGRWELIECKSAADWGFNDFKTVGPKDYLKQSHALMMTDKAKKLGVKDVRFFYLRKQTGHLWDRIHPYDPELAQEVIDEFVISNQKEEPRAPFKLVAEAFRSRPTGRLIAAFPCSYCPYLNKCQGEYQTEWKNDQFGFSKPVYVFSKKEKI